MERAPMFETAMERNVAPVYRGARRLKNRFLNLLDPPVIILGYHRVAELSRDPHLIAVSPDNFRAQMRYLRKNFTLLGMEDDWSGLEEPAVVITFDDGYADNLYEALPVLEEAGVTATFFVATGMLDSDREFWSDDLERLLLWEGEGREFRLQDPDHGGSFPAATATERRALHDRLHRLMLGATPQRREGWLEQMRKWAQVGERARQGNRALTRAELRELASSPLVTIGAHSVTHTALALLSEAEQRREIADSRRELQELSGRPVTLFSYPFGGNGQYDRTTRGLCRDLGFSRAVTTFPGQAHRWSDPFQLPRQLVRNWDLESFAAMMERFRS
jgi:peptidoglycan/xylan/chitin deacetylase (PgdA/CDA1 family)